MPGRDPRAVGLSFAIPAAMSIGCADAPTNPPAVSDAADIDDAGDAGPPMAGACGPIGPWGEWPPDDAPKRTPTVLPPAFERPDCGPGCRLVTTRWGFTGNGPWETRLSGRLLTGAPRGFARGAIVVNLDTLEEYDSGRGRASGRALPGRRPADHGAHREPAHAATRLAGSCSQRDGSNDRQQGVPHRQRGRTIPHRAPAASPVGERARRQRPRAHVDGGRAPRRVSGLDRAPLYLRSGRRVDGTVP